jgi:NAD(P)-dependent dehydrogenase (short-subunit alcohol dehydrogenase family)
MKTWFITGTSSGLGRIMTETLLERGDRVTATVRKSDALAHLQAQYGERLRVAVVDLTDTQALRREVDAAFVAHGTIDVVVSNAGYGLFGAIEELTDAQIERQIATNLTASIQLIRAALPHLRQQGSGRIVQVSSEGGQVTYPGFGLYHVTKWGIEAYIEALSKEVAPFGIECMLAEPGPTGTNFAVGLDFAAASDPYKGSPADTVRDAILSGAFKMTGDAQRTVAATIAAIDSEHMPLRLALGSVAYDNIETALLGRLYLLRTQRAIAYGADVELPA